MGSQDPKTQNNPNPNPKPLSSAAKAKLADYRNHLHASQRVAGGTPSQWRNFAQMLVSGQSEETRLELLEWISSANKDAANLAEAKAKVADYLEFKGITGGWVKPSDREGQDTPASLVENKYGSMSLRGGLVPFTAWAIELTKTCDVFDITPAMKMRKTAKPYTRLVKLGISRSILAERLPSLAPEVRGTRSPRGGRRLNMSGGGGLDMSAGASHHNMAALPAQPQADALLGAVLNGDAPAAKKIAFLKAQMPEMADALDNLAAAGFDEDEALSAVLATLS